ncbi:MAG: NAD(P)H-hydrate dehydratase [Phycisphaeraceae bacterium]|nr:NAD(P)H-hydrate dehydratase [Phycisphaeraceae bacterium]
MSDLQIIHDVPDPPPRPQAAHKGTFGTVIVVGGCSTMIGAPALAARAALRGGVGLVKIATASELLTAMLTIEPGATGIVLDGDAQAQRQAIEQADPQHQAVLAIGPGMGLSDSAGRLVENLLRGPRAIVLDADGLNLLAQTTYRHPLQGPPLVLTPHPGEFMRLAQRLGIEHDPTDEAQRPTAAAALATTQHSVVVLKGHRSVVTDGKRCYINDTGNPALATAGSGDVLTGLLASLLAQNISVLDAAVLAVHAHGRAGDLWARSHGPRGLRAGDLADLLPAALAATG